MSLTASGVEAAMETTAVPRVMPLAESRRRQLIAHGNINRGEETINEKL